MKPEDVHLPDEVPQTSLRDSLPTVPEKAAAHHQQVFFQLYRSFVARGRFWILERKLETGGHKEHLTSVRFALLLAPELPGRIRQEPLILFDGALQLFRDRRELYGLAQVLR